MYARTLTLCTKESNKNCTPGHAQIPEGQSVGDKAQSGDFYVYNMCLQINTIHVSFVHYNLAVFTAILRNISLLINGRNYN